MVGGYRIPWFVLRTPSHLGYTRCLFYGLSEFLVTLLGNSVEWHHTRC